VSAIAEIACLNARAPMFFRRTWWPKPDNER
jgi:hypothetical protein